MKYEDLVKMSVKELKDRLKDLNTQAQAAAGKDLDALLKKQPRSPVFWTT